MGIRTWPSAGTTTHYRSSQLVFSPPPHVVLLFISILFIHFSLFAHSQVAFFSPVVVSAPAFARSVNKLYVTGGAEQQANGPFFIQQTMSLDLAIPWSTNAPAWTKLAPGPFQATFPAAFSSDEQTLYAFHLDRSNSPLQYNVGNNTWNESPAKFENAAFEGISAVTDPRSGLIYLAGGYKEDNYNAPFWKFLDIFDPVTQTIHTVNLPDPAKVFPVRRYYGNVWSDHRKSIVYWGGTNQSVLDPGVVQNGVTEFSPDSNGWSTMTTQGPTPRVKKSHCMAANEGGTMLAIYGGEYVNETAVGELWVLDLVTSTWTQGPAGPPRTQAVCTIAGEQFLIWGGRVNYTAIAPSDMLIYNFNTSAYVNQYTPPTFYKDLKPPPPLTRTKAPWDTDNLTANKGHVGAAIGGAIGGLLVLMGIIAGTIIFRRRRRQVLQKTQFGSRRKGTSSYGGSAGFLGRWRASGGGNGTMEDPQEKDEDDILEQTLKELEQEQRELDKQRQFLEQQHLQDTNPGSLLAQEKRGPTAWVDDQTDIFPIPPLPPLYGSSSIISASQSTENLSHRRTVQAYCGHVGRHHEDDEEAGVGTRRQSELTQDMIEPLYGPSPEVNSAIPDLMYVPPPSVATSWTMPQQGNHPHAVVNTVLEQDDEEIIN